MRSALSEARAACSKPREWHRRIDCVCARARARAGLIKSVLERERERERKAERERPAFTLLWYHSESMLLWYRMLLWYHSESKYPAGY